MIIPFILCGGSGTRLWPMSRSGFPKQYLNLIDEYSLLQHTVLRLKGLSGVTQPIIITNQEQRFLVAEQMREIGIKPKAIVLEPEGKNTAPATAVAALLALQYNEAAQILILPADHVIQQVEQFHTVVLQAEKLAQLNKLVTFGIIPTHPHTGYGYIRCGAHLPSSEHSFIVDAFIEKPNLEKATQFIQEGGYYWNSGMFLFKATAYLQELKQFQPVMYEQVSQAVQLGQQDIDFFRLNQEAFAQCPSDSIDYAVMEHTSHAVIIAAENLGWSDIGGWNALAELSTTDENGNTLLGDVMTEHVHHSYIRAEQRMVAAIGVEHLIIVETADAVLVAHKNYSEDVKKIVATLNQQKRSESCTHRRVFRPWGSYEGIDNGERYQVKRIQVKPGASLSLQMHHHRAEHWIVVKGTAKVINGDKEILLTENQSTYIPIGCMHRLENPGKIPLELIEVQSGTYLGEDDIIRFDDKYGRSY